MTSESDWRPEPLPGSEGCVACGGLGTIAVTDICDEFWLTENTPPDQWRPCLVCQD